MTNASFEVVCGLDVKTCPAPFPIHQNPAYITETFDVIIDFSHPLSISGLIAYALSVKKPLVLCTTGLGEDLQAEVVAASEQIPIFQSGNMSYGINLLERILKQYAPLLYPQFDMEIVEKHHRRKVDAPSGTALMLANALMGASEEPLNLVHGRVGTSAKRGTREVGIHAVRGGSIVGDHSVLFCGDQEVITLTHQAESREVFAQGALRAARYLVNKGPGLYNMHTMISEEEKYASV